MTNAALVIQAPARQLELLMADLHALKGEIEQLHELLLGRTSAKSPARLLPLADGGSA